MEAEPMDIFQCGTQLLHLNNSNIYLNGSFIGINTTTPQQTLNVNGNANVTQSLTIGRVTINTDGGGNVIFKLS